MSRVVHFEIHATHPERVIPFYEQLFDWRITPWGPPGTYWLIDTSPGASTEGRPPGIDGGLVPRRGEAPLSGASVNAFVCTVQVADVAATLHRATALGGTVALARMAIPGVGWQAYIKDPDGNILGLHQPDPSAAPGG